MFPNIYSDFDMAIQLAPGTYVTQCKLYQSRISLEQEHNALISTSKNGSTGRTERMDRLLCASSAGGSAAMDISSAKR